MVTEYRTESWFDRIRSAVAGVMIGFFLFAGSIALLWWNEGDSVRTRKALDEGLANVVSVKADAVDEANASKLVHVTGETATEEVLQDPDFPVSAKAIRFRRVVEMYQWKEDKREEKEKNAGGSTDVRTTYTYQKTWSDEVIPSSSFKEASTHRNPESMPFRTNELKAAKVTLGAFTLTPGLLGQMSTFEPFPVEGAAPAGFQVADRGYYRGADPKSPQVGDVRIRFEAVKPQAVSVIARQIQSTFEPYPTDAGKSLEILRPGAMSADAMIAAEKSQRSMFTWVLRFVGFVLMAIGIALVVRPIVVVADVVPFFGDLLGLGTGLVSASGAFVISFATIAIAWFFYRPLVAVPLLVAAAVVLVLAFKLGRGRRLARKAA